MIMRKKNILYIHTHDSGRYLEPYGYNVKTPNIMKLAKEGTLFRNAYCAGPTCSPSRAGLLSGMAPHCTNMIGLAQRGFQMDAKDTHLSFFLLKNGYHTALFGVQHEVPDASMLGYEHVFDKDCHHSKFIERDTSASEEAAKYLINYDSEKPFFMSVGFINTHRGFPKGSEEYINPDYLMPPFPIQDTPENRKDMADFMHSAKIADDCVGVVLDALKKSGREDDTIVIFTTDHGIAFPFMKCNGYDTGIGVTLIMKFNGNNMCGKATDALISHIDVFPTLCDLNGLNKPENLQGNSFVKIFDDVDEKINNYIYSEITYHAAYEPMRCIRSDRYKLIKYYDYHNGYVPANMDGSPSKNKLIENGLLKHSRQREMLFDLAIDPVERNNMINNPLYKDIYIRLSRALENWMEETEDPLIHYNHRVPKPKGAFVNRLEDLDPMCTISES